MSAVLFIALGLAVLGMGFGAGHAVWTTHQSNSKKGKKSQVIRVGDPQLELLLKEIEAMKASGVLDRDGFWVTPVIKSRKSRYSRRRLYRKKGGPPCKKKK